MEKWNERCLDDYFCLMQERPDAFIQSPVLPIVTDKQRMITFMKRTQKQLGVVYKSPFRLMVVDLIAGVNGGGRTLLMKDYSQLLKKEPSCAS